MATRQPYTPSDDDYLTKYLAEYNPEPKGRMGQKLYQSLDDMEGKEWAWTKRHPWQSWRERYKNHQDRFDMKIAKLLRSKKKSRVIKDAEEEDEDQKKSVVTVKREGLRNNATKKVEKQVTLEKEKERETGKVKEQKMPKASQSTKSTQSVKPTQDTAPSSSLAMPPPGQIPVRTPKSTVPMVMEKEAPDKAYDWLDDDAESRNLSLSEGEATSQPVRRSPRKSNGATSHAPPPAQPRPSHVSKTKLVKKRPAKPDDDDIFTDASPNSSTAPVRRPTTAGAVRIEEGPFRRTVKRPRESAGDSNWPPKRQKNITGQRLQQPEKEKPALVEKQVNGQVTASQEQMQKQVAAKPRQAPVAIASTSRIRLEDLPPPPPSRPASPPRYRPQVNGVNHATRKSEGNHIDSHNVAIPNNEKQAHTRSSDPLPYNIPTRVPDNRPPRIDFTSIQKSRRSLANTSSRASVISSRSSIVSHPSNAYGSRHPSFTPQPQIQPTSRPRPRPSAIELASTQDATLLAELGLQRAITILGREYGFNDNFTMTIYEQTRDLSYTKFMLRKFQDAVRGCADDLVERFPLLLFENREEEGVVAPDVEEFMSENEEGGESYGKGKGRENNEEDEEEERQSTAGINTPAIRSPTTSRRSSVRRSRRKGARESLAEVIRPTPDDMGMDDILDYEPPGKSRAGTFMRLERRGMKEVAIELEKRRVSGEYGKKTKVIMRDDSSDEDEGEEMERKEEDRMDVDQEVQRHDQDQDSHQGSDQDEEDRDDEEHDADLGGAQVLDENQHAGDADDEEEDEDEDEQEGSIISQHAIDEQESDQLDEEDEEEREAHLEGLFTQVGWEEEEVEEEEEVQAVAEEGEEEEDDMYVSQELQPPPPAQASKDREETPVIVKMESADQQVGVDETHSEDEDQHGDEEEAEADPDQELVELAREHFRLTKDVTEKNCEELRRFEEVTNKDLVRAWSLEWARERLSTMGRQLV